MSNTFGQGSLTGTGIGTGNRTQYRKTCAWCQSLIREGEEPVSHGICPDCATQLKAEYAELKNLANKGNTAPPAPFSGSIGHQ